MSESKKPAYSGLAPVGRPRLAICGKDSTNPYIKRQEAATKRAAGRRFSISLTHKICVELAVPPDRTARSDWVKAGSQIVIGQQFGKMKPFAG
jgi:hypothetical protein